MIRRFRINNSKKGELEYTCRNQLKSGAISFEKINQHNQIIIVDESMIIDNQTLHFVYLKIGIVGNCAKIHKHREILVIDKTDYITGYKEYITKETEKAIIYLGVWIPKSQCLFENETVYIKTWIFEKNIMFFEV